MKLELGVEEIAYPDKGKIVTTGDVAEILERRYHIMRVFVELYEAQIGDELALMMGEAIESLAEGHPRIPVTETMERIEELFKSFLDRAEWESISSQFIPTAQNEGRPAFIDTGMYQDSFRARLKD